MAMLLPIIEEAENSVLTNIASLKQSAEQVERTLSAIFHAGILYQIRRHCCGVTWNGDGSYHAHFAIDVTSPASAGIVEQICRQHDGDWYVWKDGHSVISTICGINLHIAGLTFDATEERAA